MTLFGLLVFTLVFIVIASLAYWVVTKFLPGETHKIALGVIGVVLLIVLLWFFSPDAANYRVWK